MEHCVNIQREADSSENLQDSSSLSSEIDDQVPIQIKKTAQQMNEKIYGLPPQHPEPCIFKVHEGLRKVNEEAYTPTLVSIGPYHHGNPKLCAMEQHKLRYLHCLLQRRHIHNNDDTITVEPYLLLMDKLADRAQACYADPICLERDKFVEMLLLDACFIIEFLRKRWFKQLRDNDDPIFGSSWMKLHIYRDLILLENQLPFFVLHELFDMTHIPVYEYVPLTKMVVELPIRNWLPRKSFTNRMVAKITENTYIRESKHFLDLVHRFYLPSFGEASNPTRCTRMFSVTKLQEAGISFKVDDRDDVSIFDITFEDGHMKIPKIRVSAKTNTFLRNIVAYEQHSSPAKTKYFTDYIFFMDSLINTEKDVNVLCIRGIIDNASNSDEGVASIFNDLGDGVVVKVYSFYYSDVCQKVNDYCGKRWNPTMAYLRRNYFNNPWASISTAAAAAFLFLTLTETIVALINLLA